MIDLAPTTGRPSQLHESRAHTLAAMARLTGHVVEIEALPDGGRPDVLLIRPGDRSVFIGDAKATETPGNTETALRLSRYARFLARYVTPAGRELWHLSWRLMIGTDGFGCYAMSARPSATTIKSAVASTFSTWIPRSSGNGLAEAGGSIRAPPRNRRAITGRAARRSRSGRVQC